MIKKIEYNEAKLFSEKIGKKADFSKESILYGYYNKAGLIGIIGIKKIGKKLISIYPLRFKHIYAEGVEYKELFNHVFFENATYRIYSYPKYLEFLKGKGFKKKKESKLNYLYYEPK